MAQLTKEKSAFDVLMNKINKKDHTKSVQPKLKPDKKESNSYKKNDENDIIILSVEKKALQVEKKKEQNETSRIGDKATEKECQEIAFFDNPLHLQHTQQYSKSDSEFLKSLSNAEANFQLKQQIDPDRCLVMKIDCKSRLDFDFTRFNPTIETRCTCCSQSIRKDDTGEKSDFTNKTIDSLNDTLDDGCLELSISSSHLVDTSSSSRHPKRRKTETKSITNNDSTRHQLWTEKYQFKDENEIVANKSQFERLKEWLTNWKSILSKSQHVKDRSNDDDTSDSEFSCDSDFSTDSVSSNVAQGHKFYSNAILLSGPHGSGKTSSIYAVAKQLGFKIFEVNASSSRCKSQIIQELDGVLNSHHVSNKSKANKFETNKQETSNLIKMEKFFKSVDSDKKTKKIEMKPKAGQKRKNKSRRLKNEASMVIELSSADEYQSDKSTSDQSNVNIHRESLILFDEIDVVFREDVGFWAAINHFIKRSKKPIVLTTSEVFLQEKINLNIEKIEYVRPRIDTAVRFLKHIAHAESIRLDTSTAFKIIQECRCDMRRSLCQLQALIGNDHDDQSSMIKKYKSKDSTNLNLNKFFTNCSLHDNGYCVDTMLYLDNLTRRIVHYLHLETNCAFNREQPVNFKRYDLSMLRDGLTDNTLSGLAFNPFVYQQTNETRPRDDLLKLNTTFLKENLCDYFENLSCLLMMNKRQSIDLNTWLNYDTISHYDFVSNVSINRLAESMCKFTSNKSLCVDYRPFLHEICKLEESKQASNPSKRRYMHYLSYMNIGLIREDYGLLAKSSLDEKNHQQHVQNPTLCSETNIFDSDIFSND